jgi:hypothetical protein
MSLDFYQTVGGRQFIDGTMKNISRSLERIADSLEKMGSTAEQEEEQLCQQCLLSVADVVDDDHGNIINIPGKTNEHY